MKTVPDDLLLIKDPASNGFSNPHIKAHLRPIQSQCVVFTLSVLPPRPKSLLRLPSCPTPGNVDTTYAVYRSAPEAFGGAQTSADLDATGQVPC